jgi:methylphosphotriester-DNA--protein-cysteine methyltransferase
MDVDSTACYRAIATRGARFNGRLFVGVKITGVYCRPICPVRTPNVENASFDLSAAGPLRHRTVARAAQPRGAGIAYQILGP